MNSTTFNLSSTMANRHTQRRENWETNFEKNSEEFSVQVAQGIVNKVLLKMEETCKDYYLLIPNKAAPLKTNFSFEIVKSKDALALKELAEDKADLPPFKEWIERFSLPNQKINPEVDSFKSFTRTPEHEKGIDREYFQEMMAVIGRSVETQLNLLFKEVASRPNNTCLRTEIIWHRKADQLLTSPSDFHDNSIDIKIWAEEQEQKQLGTITSTGSNIIVKERLNRQKIEFRRQLLIIGVIVFVATLVIAKIFSQIESKKT